MPKLENDLGVKMKIFDVFQLPDGSYRAVKYGYSWPSFFFNWIWCFFFARLYGWGAVWIGVWFISGVVDKIVGEPTVSDEAASLALGIGLTSSVIMIGFGVWFSFNANEFRRRKYAQLGYSLVRRQAEAANQNQAIFTARQEKSTTKDEKLNEVPPIEKNVGQPNTPVATASTPRHVSRSAKNEVLSDKMGHSDTEQISKMPDMLIRKMELENNDVDPKNDPVPETSDVSESDDGWSDEFKILYEYDPIVKECHDELEDLGPQLSAEFQEEVVSDRKKATDIRDRLKAAQEEKMKPYGSESLNEALATARLLGPGAEEEFSRVVAVMGEDIEVEDVLGRLTEKHGISVSPEDIDADLEYWDIVEHGDEYFSVGRFNFTNRAAASIFARDKFDEFFNEASFSTFADVLTSSGYIVQRVLSGNYHVTADDGTVAVLMVDEFPRYIKGVLTPKEIRQIFDYLNY